VSSSTIVGLPQPVALTAAPYSPQPNRWLDHTLRMPKSMVTGSVEDPQSLFDGTFSDDVDPGVLLASDELGAKRAEEVKAAMVHSWSMYRTNAWGSDVILPRSGKRKEIWGGQS
jgi:hypothetical protein